jgi:putative endonuclease
MTNWFVYILNCRGGRLYTGVAVDVEQRFAQHLAGKGARFTRAFPPEAILASWCCANRRIALQLEYAIKQLSVAQKRALIAGHSVKLSNRLVLEHGIWCEPCSATE